MLASADPGPDTPLRQGRVARLAWLGLGLLLVGVGFFGLFVPLLPTIDFLLLAMPCFARSSPRLEAWLLNHPRLGPGINAWRAERAVPRRAKILACGGMSAGYVLFWLHVRPGVALSIAVVAFLLFWAVWIIHRPEPGANA
ncbi:Putative membrane protein [Sphingopyxis fribergensis]|uniref:Putative membrane protein n=1 Tax=Sphingopyxis fribergensis TaxID=1515612 RepID=A0A0A7PPR2_9SPHN|nr:YbaN family protein [Sphingopyxis fribergensis]AJA11193.1 Putative membrane protein [Sphingopyxis fribergensis]